MDAVFDITTHMADLTDFVQRTMAGQAAAKASNQVATVKTVSGSSCAVELPSGQVVRGLDMPRQRLAPGDSVTIEAGYPGLWQIVGVGGMQSA